VDVFTALLVLKCRAENRRLLPKSEILFARQAFEVFGAMRSELCLHVELKGSLARRSSKPIKRGLAHYLLFVSPISGEIRKPGTPRAVGKLIGMKLCCQVI
jgi:hypothetical protein